MSLLEDIGGFLFGWLQPEQPKQEVKGLQVSKPASDAPLPVIYGKRRVEGTIVFKGVVEGEDGDDVPNDLLYIVIVWGEAVASIDEIYLGDYPSTDARFDADDKGGRWVFVDNFPNGMAGHQDSFLKKAGWDPVGKNHRLDECACSIVRLEWSIGEDAPLRSEPSITADVTGRVVRVLNGSGSWVSANPVECLYDYLTNPVYGKGLSDDDLNMDWFRYADAQARKMVPVYQGAEEEKPLFTCNAVIDTGKSLRDNVGILLGGMRGYLPVINGQLSPVIEQDDPPAAYPIRPTHIRGDMKYSESGKKQRYNRVIVEFDDADMKFSTQQATYPDPGDELFDTWLAEDNGVLLEHRVKHETITNYYEARQMARVVAMLSREALTVELEVSPVALRYTIGDVIPVYHPKTGWEGKPFRLLKARMLADGWFKLTLREHQPISTTGCLAMSVRLSQIPHCQIRAMSRCRKILRRIRLMMVRCGSPGNPLINNFRLIFIEMGRAF